VLESDPEVFTKLIGGVGGLTTTVDGVLTENRGEFKTMAVELAAAAKDLRALAAAARTQLEPGGKTNALIDDASATAKWARSDKIGLHACLAACLHQQSGQKHLILVLSAAP
jgi:hypothetical protein